MLVRYEEETGWPSRLQLHRRISAYVRVDRVRAFKVGITCNPEVRARAYNGEYDEMVVVYRTSSDKHVRELEAFLVEYYDGYSDNERGGGGGARGAPPYYLYVVLKR